MTPMLPGFKVEAEKFAKFNLSEETRRKLNKQIEEAIAAYLYLKGETPYEHSNDETDPG